MPYLFTSEEKISLLTRLPPLELSYEPKMHKKVYADLYRILPKGPKAIVWYTRWHEQPACLLILLNERGNYSDVKLFPTIFAQPLALGTIIYGTYFNYHGGHYFTCEHLYYSHGVALDQKSLAERMELLMGLFQDDQLGQKTYTADFLVVGLPVLTKTYEEALVQLETLPYKTYGIGGYQFSKQVHAASPAYQQRPIPMHVPQQRPIPMHVPQQRPVPMHVPQQRPVPQQLPTASPATTTYATTTYATTTYAKSFNKNYFKIKAGLAADIYHLYTVDDTFYATAAVPSYKASVMLNGLFRKIKENTNLDLLEESDEEEEFENTQMDKFVDLEKSVVMECVYLKKFRKWQPLKVITLSSVKLMTKKEAQQIENI
jgi:hypothetical protein